MWDAYVVLVLSGIWDLRQLVGVLDARKKRRLQQKAGFYNVTDCLCVSLLRKCCFLCTDPEGGGYCSGPSKLEVCVLTLFARLDFQVCCWCKMKDHACILLPGLRS